MAAAHTLNTPSISSTTAAALLTESRRTSGYSSTAVFPLSQAHGRISSSFFGARLRAASTERAVLRRSQPRTVLMTLPPTKVRGGSERKLRWSSRSIRAYTLGEQEARELKYPKNGTESIVIGILVEGTSAAAKYLRANGITFYNVRDATVESLGKSSSSMFSHSRLPLTEQAQEAIDCAIELSLKSGGWESEITPAHLLLGVWAQKNSAGHMILKTLGFNDVKAKEFAKSMDRGEPVYLPGRH